MRSKQMDMLHGSLWKKIILFALPIAFTNLLQQLFNSADVAVVGQFAGSEALAAVGANAPVITLIVNVFFGLSIGTNVIIADYIGRNNKEGIKQAVHTSILVALISGLIIMGVGMTLAPLLLELIAVPENIIGMAVVYLRIYFAGMPFIMLYYFETAIFRSMGDTRTPLFILLVAGVINVGLNLFFVAILKMDVDGVAIATVISNVVSSIILFVILHRRNDDFKVRFSDLKINGRIHQRMIKIGVPAGLQGAVFSVSNVIIQSAVNSLGSVAVAASTASSYFEMYSYCFANAFGHAATTFVGQNYGAGILPRCRQSSRICIILGIATSGFLGAIFAIFASPFGSIYTSDAEVLALIVIRLHIIVVFEWMNTIDDVLVGTLRVYGRTVMPTIIYVISICGVRIAWVYSIFRMWHEYNVLSWVYPVSWLVANIAVVTAYFLVIRKLKRTMPETS